MKFVLNWFFSLRNQISSVIDETGGLSQNATVSCSKSIIKFIAYIYLNTAYKNHVSK